MTTWNQYPVSSRYMKPETKKEIQFHLEIQLFSKVTLFLNITAEVEPRGIFRVIWSYNVCDAYRKYKEADYLHGDSFLLFCYLVMFKSNWKLVWW
jgi:hypothetical protein